jgi:hypothetical protein
MIDQSRADRTPDCEFESRLRYGYLSHRLSFYASPFLAHFPKVDLCDLHAVCVSPLSTFQCLNQSLWKLVYTVYHGTWAHLNGVLHKSFSSVCVSVCVSLLSLQGNGSVKCIPPFGASIGSVDTFPRQRIHTTIEELLDASFSMRSVSYQRRVCMSVSVFPYRC